MLSELLSFSLFLAAITLYITKAGRHSGWFTSILIVLGLFIVLNITLYACNYFTGDGINDAVLYTLTNSLSGAGVGKYILPGAGLILGVVAIFAGLAWLLRRRQRPYHLGYSLVALILALASVDASPAFHQLTELVRSQSREGAADFGTYYKVPNKRIPDPKLNLVYIYGESLERTYFNNDAFPDLAPELGKLKQQGLDFSHISQLPGTDYTIAGMVASQCGIPLFAPFEGNASSSVSSFFPRNLCLGDILKNSGYENYFVQGASLRFAGKDVFLKSHGFDHLYGADELKSTVADPQYRNDWGYYDDTVLDAAWDKFAALSKAGKRFSLFTLTVDTHHPDGFISRSCTRRSYRFDGKENKSFAAVACSQQHIAAFIEKIKASPWYKNTVIVVTSDHLAMNNTAWKYLNQQDRNDLFLVLRGDQPAAEVIAAKRNSMDNGATVLDILGGDNYLGLGRSTLSSESLSQVFINIKEKVMSWKPNIIKLWNFPTSITNFTVDQQAQVIRFSGSEFRLPLLIRLGEKRIEPLPESEYSAPLRYQLADFAPRDNFIWVDNCYKMARLWDPSLALSTGLCVAQGQLGSEPEVQAVTKPVWEGKSQPTEGVISTDRYQKNVDLLKIVDNNIRYKADSFVFSVAGAPEEVKQFNGISRPENWGRWSNANIDKAVTIEYNNPLPSAFDMVIRAKAFGPNIGKPIPVQVGPQQQTLTLAAEVTTTRLHFTNPAGSHVLTITPPLPQSTNEGNILGHGPRQLGIGMVDIKIEPRAD